jgi:hypothetical protein
LVPSYVIYLANSDVSKNDVSSFEDIICAGCPLPSGMADKVIKNLNLKYFRQGMDLLLRHFITYSYNRQGLVDIEHDL